MSTDSASSPDPQNSQSGRGAFAMRDGLHVVIAFGKERVLSRA